ncbi:DUF4129 domain-containing protein [Natronorubrum sp. JWXQ-INN-674]|uniref:DUF4129 domain-containing protein n=1 Tax=Natronorubrum halalkaliphilum TaxID=2691917 RepID=A0A6B0VRR2_9EURY|nr:DUF4129 domain-containing protein [Natronorubrum halalkaliphilum]MXV63656.1 DUF4129 domain-containing protein [Natronorubrum halalkaliphilum]
MTDARRLLFVLGCLCCLLIVASALPAADPRLDGPGPSEGGTTANDWDALTSSSDPATELTDADADDDTDADGNNDESDDTDDTDATDETHPIAIDGAVEPGNDVVVEVEGATHFDTKAVEVNDETVGETNRVGRVDAAVPYEETMTVTVPDENLSRTVDVPTGATIETDAGVAPDQDIEVAAAVGSTLVTNATVSIDGEAVATTDERGTATVTLPETAGSAELHVERGPVEGERTIDVPEPTVEFASDPIVLPGFPAPVQVSADGAAVPNATVVLESGDELTTDENGQASLWMPVDDEATVTADVGAETASATVENLYLRLTAIVVLGPGLLLGLTITYLRVVASRDRRRGAVLSDLFLSLADVFSTLGDGFRRPTVSWPTISLPSLRIGRSLPSIGTLVPSLTVGSLRSTLPSLGSFSRSSSGRGDSLFRDRFGSTADGDSANNESNDTNPPELAAEPLGPDGPRAEVRTAWHAFLDRLGVENRTTRTPGQLARKAIAAGFPATNVRRLVALFRDVEYGTRDPSPDRVAEVRDTVSELLEYDRDPEDEEGSE